MKIKYFFIAILVISVLSFVGIKGVKAASIQELQDQIAQLMAQITALQSNQKEISGTVVPAQWCHTFNQNLGYAQSGSSEVGYLHAALEKQGILYSPDMGNIYGEPTMLAVKKFQERYGITPAVGYFGVLTRTKINSLYSCAAAYSASSTSSVSKNQTSSSQSPIAQISISALTPIKASIPSIVYENSSTQNSANISHLSSSQIKNLAQIYSQRLAEMRKDILPSTSQTAKNLINTLKSYNVSESVQTELDVTNSKAATWVANYNDVFAKSDVQKKKLASLKPDDKIKSLLASPYKFPDFKKVEIKGRSIPAPKTTKPAPASAQNNNPASNENTFSSNIFGNNNFYQTNPVDQAVGAGGCSFGTNKITAGGNCVGVSCPAGQTCNPATGACCTPNCPTNSCNIDDGCGGCCWTCLTGEQCVSDNTCCAPDCEGKSCGDPNGCGGTCRDCPTGQECSWITNTCCTPDCPVNSCGTDNGCGNTCWTCADNQVCNFNTSTCCTPNCDGKDCGSDGCGGVCGTCLSSDVCNSSGQCINPGFGLPAFFDWRNVGGKSYITSIRDQGQCGSCWAFATNATLEGTINAYYNDPNVNINPDLSEQDLVSCFMQNGCNGATSFQIQDIFKNYLVNTGITSESCSPYILASGGSSACSKCSDWQSQVWKTDSSYMSIDLVNNNIQKLEYALVNYGPVEVGMTVYNDLFSYTGGVYSHTTNGIAGYHAVTIVGYGVESDMPYWIVKNSWGTDWGESGYFRIRMGDSQIDQWFAYAPGIPYYTTSIEKVCTDTDLDGYCYWGTGVKPDTGCPSSCDSNAVEDCDDSNTSIYTNCGQLSYDTGILNVSSTPDGTNVYVQSLSDGSWNLMGQTPISFMLQTGTRKIKLTAQDYLDDIESVSITKDNISNLNATLAMAPKITSPQNDDVLRAGDIINIIGTIGSGGFRTYTIEWSSTHGASWSNEGITLSGGGVWSGGDSFATLAQWNTSFIASSGFYNLRLVSQSDSMTYYVNLYDVYLDLTLVAGWPQRIAFQQIPCPWDSTGQALAYTSSKYYAQPDLNRETRAGKGEVKVIENTNKNFAGAYTVNLESFSQNFSSSQCLVSTGFLEPVVADLNNDGKKETIVYSGGDPPKLYVFNQDGSLMWKKDISPDSGAAAVAGGNVTSPIVGDINNDGKKEIIVYNPNIISSSSPSILYALNGDGSVLWKKYVPLDWSATMLMADLDSDGKQEIVIQGNNAFSKKMSVIDNSGNLLYSWDLPNSSMNTNLHSNPAVGHFDDLNSEKLQIVSIMAGPGFGYNPDTKHYTNQRAMYIFNKDGSILSGWPIYLPQGTLGSSPVVGDINHDGKDEIVAGLIYSTGSNDVFPDTNLGGLYAFDRNGNILPGWPVEKGWNFWSTPALGDVDGDGYLEISASRLGSVTYLFRYDGSIVSGWPQYTSWNDYHGSIMGDVNNDNKIDILTTAGNGFHPSLGSGGVYAWNSSGTKINGFPKATEVDAQASAVISDLDGDGKAELIASSDWDNDFIIGMYKNRGSIYVWNTNQPYNEENMPWPMFMHDAQRTGCYDCEATPPPTDYCDQLYNRIVASNQKSCGDELYDPVADIDKDKTVGLGDISYYAAHQTDEAWCQQKLDDTTDPCECIPSWQCSDWNSCINSQQTRTCTDLNNCGINTGKPAESQTCSSGSCFLLLGRIGDSWQKKCGDTAYDPVADLNKDKTVDLLDSGLYSENQTNETWCQQKLNDTTSPCATNYCSQLYSKINASWHKSCGDAGYDPVADIDKDKTVGLGDLGIYSGNQTNETWCQQKLNATNSPCVACISNWNCTAWSECANSQQTRTCTDLNNCGINTGKPAESQTCSSGSCFLLLGRIGDSWQKKCGDTAYDPVADLNKDKTVDLLDSGLYSENQTNETWCQQKLNDTTSPCELGYNDMQLINISDLLASISQMIKELIKF